MADEILKKKKMTLADLPPEPGIEESPLLEIPGAKEAKRKAFGRMKEAGVPEIAVEAADVMIPESLEGAAGKMAEGMRGIKKAMAVGKDYKKAMKGHDEVKRMLEASAGIKKPAEQAVERTLNYEKLGNPAHKIPRGEVTKEGYKALQNEGQAQDLMESLAKLERRDPEAHKKAVARLKAKGVLPEQD